MKYRKLRNKANEQIRKDKKAANEDRIAKAKSKAEVWRIISEISDPKAKEEIKLVEQDKLISDEKEVANKLNEFFVDKIKVLIENIEVSKVVDPLKILREKMSKSNLNFELNNYSCTVVHAILIHAIL